MKIIQVCQRYYPDIGGIETHVKEISEILVKKGIDVEVICTDFSFKLPKHETINGVKVTRFWTFAPRDTFFFSPQMYFYLISQECDVIHAHNYHAFPALFAAFAKCRRRFIFTPHYHRGGHTIVSNLLHKPYKFLGKMIFSRADVVVCVSEYEKKLLTSDFEIVGGKIHKIPNGINLEEFKNIKPLKRQVYQKTLLYVGRLEEYKGVQHIIEILPLLPEYSLDIIGAGPYESKLHELANDLNVSGQIEWLKNVPRYQLFQHYASADVFLMLSQHEAYGITVAEALASGTPCMVAMGSALDEFVDGVMCVGVKDPSDKKQLILNIQSLSVFRGKFNKKIQNWDEVSDQLLEIYTQINGNE